MPTSMTAMARIRPVPVSGIQVAQPTVIIVVIAHHTPSQVFSCLPSMVENRRAAPRGPVNAASAAA
jgi:hypothetical protein